MTAAAENPSKPEPMKTGWWDEALAKHKGKRCTAHKHNGEQCRKFAIDGTNVCRVHGGAAPQVKRAARLRLEMASDQLARRLLDMTNDPNVADPVKLAAIKDALDRSGIQAKTAVTVEVSTKPFELVFDSISSRPNPSALETGQESLDAGTDNYSDAYEFPDEIEDDPNEIEAEVVEVIEDQPDTPDTDDSSLSVDPGGPLGMHGPAGSGLMRLEDAVEAVSDMRAREAARIRDMRRR